MVRRKSENRGGERLVVLSNNVYVGVTRDVQTVPQSTRNPGGFCSLDFSFFNDLNFTLFLITCLCFQGSKAFLLSDTISRVIPGE